MKKTRVTTRRNKIAKNNNNNNKQQDRGITNLGKALRVLGSAAGSYTGSLVGHPAAGQMAGAGLGAAISKWLGQGDYTVQQNSILTQTLKGSSSIPAMHRQDQTIVVRHREFVTQIRSSTDFSVQTEIALNPGLSTFPWLSALARNFQEYAFKGVVFHYVPTSGMISGANPSLGSVMIQTAYRTTDVAPTSKYELLNEFWANECMPSEPMAHPIECKSSETILGNRYIRAGNVDKDLLFYDLGRTFIATAGQQTANLVLGDIWVTYEVELRKPKMNTAMGKNLPYAKASGSGLNSHLAFSNLTLTSNIPGLTYTSGALDRYRTTLGPYAPGQYMTYWHMKDPGGALVLGPASFFSSNCTITSVFTPLGMVGNANEAFGRFAFTVTNPTDVAYVELAQTCAAAGVVSIEVVTIQIDDDITLVP